MQAWIEFFFGSPQRALRTVLIVLVAMMVLSEDFRYMVLSKIENFVSSIIGPALLLGIVIYAFRRMLGPLWPGGRGRH
ncbi:MAG TPA: hypothetical protein VL306_00475 [Methylomirabilota bacterium]|jgi:hypothetical protein|nr:hypothetical protein [Methylomirabilota bacterium]